MLLCNFWEEWIRFTITSIDFGCLLFRHGPAHFGFGILDGLTGQVIVDAFDGSRRASAASYVGLTRHFEFMDDGDITLLRVSYGKCWKNQRHAVCSTVRLGGHSC